MKNPYRKKSNFWLWSRVQELRSAISRGYNFSGREDELEQCTKILRARRFDTTPHLMCNGLPPKCREDRKK